MALLERLLAKISVDGKTGCWNWTGYRNAGGYGVVKADGKCKLAHRASFEVHRGPISSGMLVCHHCDNRACLNPEHLFLGSGTDNNADRDAKGRQARFKLTEADVVAIRSIVGIPQHKIAKQYGIAQSLVSFIRSGKRWKLDALITIQ